MRKRFSNKNFFNHKTIVTYTYSYGKKRGKNLEYISFLCYNLFMHKVFYASGFLYRPKSQQILLQQVAKDPSTATSSPWSIFGGINRKEEKTEIAFQRIIYDLLKVKLATKSIYAIYDYFHSGYKKFHYVFYGEVSETQNIHAPKGIIFSWFTFKQIIKLPFTEATKQDIIVGQRVIQAKLREGEAVQPINPQK